MDAARHGSATSGSTSATPSQSTDQPVARRTRTGFPRHPLINSGDAVLELRRTYGVRLAPATIRQWASRGHIGSYGFRRERFDLREVIAHARDRGLIDTDRGGMSH